MPSVFVLEHGRLWLVAQRGYAVVPDGITVESGITGRAVRLARAQLVDRRARGSRLRRGAAGRDLRARDPAARRTGGHRDPQHRVRASAARRSCRGAAPSRPRPHSARRGAAVATHARPLGAGSALRPSRQPSRSGRHRGARRGLSSPRPPGGSDADRRLGRARARRRSSRPGGRRPAPDRRSRPTSWTSHAAQTDPSVVCQVLELGAARGPGKRSVVWLPLRANAGELGAMVGISGESAHVDPALLDTAAVLAAHVAASLDAAFALQRERLSAVTDPLTRILNRRGLEERLERELAVAQERRMPLSLLVIDCDDFKEINDRAGHEFGDTLLQEVADVLGALASRTALRRRVSAATSSSSCSRARTPTSAEALGAQIRSAPRGGAHRRGLPAQDLRRRLDVSLRRSHADRRSCEQATRRSTPRRRQERIASPRSASSRCRRLRPGRRRGARVGGSSARTLRRLRIGPGRRDGCRQGDRGRGDSVEANLQPAVQDARLRRRGDRMLRVARRRRLRRRRHRSRASRGVARRRGGVPDRRLPAHRRGAPQRRARGRSRSPRATSTRPRRSSSATSA